MISNRVNFSISFRNRPDSIPDVWRAVASFLKQEGCLADCFEVSQIAGHPKALHSRKRLVLSAGEIAHLAEERNLHGFQISAGEGEARVLFRMANAEPSNLGSTLRCLVDREARAPSAWGGLVEGLMRLFPSVGGWQWHQYYQQWQWVTEIGKSYQLLYGELPPGSQIRTEPFTGPSLTPQPNKVFVDNSLNPGRLKELLPMVQFYPTAEMWLGPDFWQYAKCTKEDALAADFFLEIRDTPHFLYLKSWSEPYSRPDGEQGRQQQRLWKLFFDDDCEWPPGSGGISDVPMYGPPELWPDVMSRAESRSAPTRRTR